MYPLTLGANIGTTFTAILSSLVSTKVEALQVALCHLFFNIFGILIWYPIPFMRRIPLNMARMLGKTTRIWRGFPLVYILVVFFVIPGILLGISAFFTQGSVGFTVLGSFVVIAVVGGIIYSVFWWRYRDGKAKCVTCMEQRQRRKTTFQHIPDDMDYLKSEVAKLKEHTGLADEEEDTDVEKGTDEFEAEK